MNCKRGAQEAIENGNIHNWIAATCNDILYSVIAQTIYWCGDPF